MGLPYGDDWTGRQPGELRRGENRQDNAVLIDEGLLQGLPADAAGT